MGATNRARIIGAALLFVGLSYLLGIIGDVTSVQPWVLQRPSFWLFAILAPLVLGAGLLFVGATFPSRRPSRRRIAYLVLILAVLYNAYEAWQLARIDAAFFVLRLLLLAVCIVALLHLLLSRSRLDSVVARETAPPRTEEEPHREVVSHIADDDAHWHDALEQSLLTTGVQERRRRPWWPLLLLLIVLAAGWSIFVTATQQIDADAPAGVQALISIVLSLLGVVTLGTILAQMKRWIQQRRARSAEQELRKKRARRPVFYLRSFALDDEIGQATPLDLVLNITIANPEQAVTTILRECGPVIAIGRPGERLPALGAARFYVSQELWQEKVADVVKVSQLVLWATGVTPGLRWELAHLLRSVPPEKLILWAHPQLLDLDQEEKEAEWRRFLAGLGTLFPQPFPEQLGQVRFFYFDKDYRPVPVAGGNPVAALTSVLTAKAVPPFDPQGLKKRRFWQRIRLGGLIVFLLVIAGFILFAIVSGGFSSD